MEGVQDLAPIGLIVSTVLGLVVLGIRLLFRGGLVPRITVVDMKEQHQSQIKTYELIIQLYKDECDVKQRTIDTLSSSVDKLSEAQHTTNALIKGLSDAVEALRLQRQGSRDHET